MTRYVQCVGSVLVLGSPGVDGGLVWVNGEQIGDGSGLETGHTVTHNRWQKTPETTEKGGGNGWEGKEGWLAEVFVSEKEASRPLGSTEKASNKCGVGAGTFYPPCSSTPCATAEVYQVNLW